MKDFGTWVRRLFIVATGPVATYGSRFLRNLILSRMLAPDEFGAALAITVVLGLIGQVTDVALDRFVMIEGTEPSLSTSHAVSVCRALLVAGITILIAPEMADIFGLRADWQSFAVAGGLSAIGGFGHLGVKQVQRTHVYAPEAYSRLVANIAAVAALFPAVALFHDHRAIVLSYLVEWSGYVGASHLLSRTRYTWSLNRVLMGKIVSFSLPLTINGIGLAFINQLDRVIVGHWFGVKVLASYSVALSLSVMPTAIVVSTLSNISLSYLLSSPPDSGERALKYRYLTFFFGFLSTLYLVALCLSLNIFIPLIYGPAYSVTQAQQVLFAAIAYFSLQRSGAPTALLLAAGRTRMLAALNLSAGVGLVYALVLISILPSITEVLVGLLVGEFTAFALSLILADDRRNWRSNLFLYLAISIPGPLIVGVSALTHNHDPIVFLSSILFAGLLTLGFQIFVRYISGEPFLPPRQAPRQQDA